MGTATKIEWTDATWNPWQGCTKVSPACTHCYMFADMKRYGRDGSIVRKSAHATWGAPIKRWKKGERAGQYKIAPGSKVFTCSWSDWFHASADPWRGQAWDIIRQRPDVIFQIVTKRTERIAQCLPPDWGWGWNNVWLIATVENQEWANKRIRQLLDVPAKVRGLSCEPLLGPLRIFGQEDCPRCGGDGCDPDLWRIDRHPIQMDPDPCQLCNLGSAMDWIICGGESGPHARPFDIAWARSIVAQCKAAGVACFVKQLGERVYDSAAWEDGNQFTSYEQWVNKAGSWLGGVSGGGYRYKKPEKVVCVDAAGRRCTIGSEFMRAESEGTFPVKWHHIIDTADKKGGDWSEWPEDLRVREFSREVARA